MGNKPAPAIAAAGTWTSSITASSLSRAGMRLSAPLLYDDHIYWIEGRPTEQGRGVLVKCDQQGRTTDLTPAPYDVRSRVHEYGGGAYVIGTGRAYFVNAKDQGIYAIEENGRIDLVCSRNNLRFADLVIDERHQRLIAIAEAHANTGEPENYLCSIDLTDGTLKMLHRGEDFYSSPTLDRDCDRLAWLSWNHPDMPWDRTRLHLATLNRDDGALENVQVLREGSSLLQPMFGPDQQLYFCSDHDNWWAICRIDASGRFQQLCHDEAEYGMAQWVFGQSLYGFIDNQTLIAARVKHGLWDAVLIDLVNPSPQPIDPWPYTAVDHLSAGNSKFVMLAGNEATEASVILCTNLAASFTVLQTASSLALDPRLISAAQVLRYPTSEQDEAYGFFYAPVNPGYALPPGELPPLIVNVHGGPTTATSPCLNPRFQFWTSRGFAVLDVNYRGSTGYGRDYRQKLRGNWGLHDVQDCIHGARQLVEQGVVDKNRLFIMGGSAGGYTVLCALAFEHYFSGGISLYGVADLELLAGDTHKFEARYADSLIAPYDRVLYRQRSPLYAAKQIRVPVLFFQGTEDKVVPPNQTEHMLNALIEQKIPTACVLMEGEGHGFRRSDSIETLLDCTLEFLCRLMGHPPGRSAYKLNLYNEQQLQPGKHT